ncbi:MAG: hypothetical protein AABX75_01855 [Nanoarchaeota archaeon]
MKTVYDGLFGRIELSDDLLARVEAAAADVEEGLEDGRHTSIEFYINGNQTPRFVGGEPNTPIIRVAAGGKPYSNEGPAKVRAYLGYYFQSDHSKSEWFSDTECGDVRKSQDICFNELFVRVIYNDRTGLTDLRLVKKAHLGLLASAIFTHAKADAEQERGRGNKEKVVYLTKVYRAAEKASKHGNIKPLVAAIKTNPERKIWRRHGGGCC